jgi:hypothetical protein
MTEKKVGLFWVFIGFGLSYIIFGLSQTLQRFSIEFREVVGWVAVVCGIIFIVFGWIRFGKNE